MNDICILSEPEVYVSRVISDHLLSTIQISLISLKETADVRDDHEIL